MVSTGSRLEHPGLRGENPGPMFTAFLSSWFTACGLGVNPCQAPAPSGHDPVIRDGHFNLTGLASLDVGLLVHLLDLATDPEEGRLYGSGTGGLWAFDMEGEGGLVYRGGFREDIADTYSRVAVLQDGLVAVLDRSTIAITAPDRDNRFNGVRILDVRDPEAITQVGMVSLSDVSYLDAVEDTLFVLRHQGLLEVYELSNPAVPVLVATMTGLGNPRSMTRPDEEGWVFVADGELGLVPVDLSDPFAPVLQEPVPTAGSPVDIERTANQVFVALGSDGLESFQYAGSELQSLGVQDSGGTATQVAARDGLVWVANLDGVSVFRQVSGALPALHGFEATDLFSLCVEPIPHRQGAAYACAWSDLLLFQADRQARAPQAVLATTELHLARGTLAAEMSLTNRGTGDLRVTEVSSWSRGVEGILPSGPIESGEVGAVTLEFPDGFRRGLEICVASTDPGAGVQTFTVTTGKELGGNAIGVAAPEFSLPDVERKWHSLSDYRGKPVLLVWFATW